MLVPLIIYMGTAAAAAGAASTAPTGATDATGATGATGGPAGDVAPEPRAGSGRGPDGTAAAIGSVPQATGTVEALDPRAAEAERRSRVQALITVAGLIAGVAGYLAWRRIRALSPEAVRLDVAVSPAAARPGDALAVRVQIQARAALEHGGVRAELVRRTYAGPRPRKSRARETVVAASDLCGAGALGEAEVRALEATLQLPPDAAASFDHAFAVDLPAGRAEMLHWVVRAVLRLGAAEVHGEQLVRVGEGTAEPSGSGAGARSSGTVLP
jgi:hypothetical protein